MLPMTAIPVAPPTSRERSLSAEPTPCWAGGSASVIALVAGVIAAPIPTPSTTSPAAISAYGVWVPAWAMIARPTETSARPPAQTVRVP